MKGLHDYRSGPVYVIPWEIVDVPSIVCYPEDDDDVDDDEEEDDDDDDDDDEKVPVDEGRIINNI
jgi:hypothetical protein